MATTKLKIIYAEKAGKPCSYQYLEESESARAIKIIEALKRGKASAKEISEFINASRHSTTRTINKLTGAIRIEPKKYNYQIEIKNSIRNPNINLGKPAFYKPTLYVRIRGEHK